HEPQTARGAHRLQDALPDAHHKDVAAQLPVIANDVLQHVDAAEVDVIDVLHAQQQEALLGVALVQPVDFFFHVVHGAEVEVALDIDDAELGAARRVGPVGKVAEIGIGQHFVYARHAGAKRIVDEAEQDAQQHGKLDGQEHGRQ